MSLRRLYRWGGFAITALAAAYFIAYAVEYAATMPPLPWNARSLAAGVGALVLYGAAMALNGCAWHLLLGSCGERPRLAQSFAIYLLAQFAKYIPGNIAQHIGRVALAEGYGFKLPRVVFAMTLEITWAIATAATLAALTLLSGGIELFRDAPRLPPLWLLGVALVAAAIVPFAAHWVLWTWRPGPLRRLMGQQIAAAPGAGVLLACFVLYVLNFALLGAAVDVLARGLFGATDSHFLLLTGVFATAWVAGFLTPGAPAGLGVREAVLLLALGPVYGTAALGLSVALRLVTTLGDGLGFVAGLMARRYAGRPS